MQSLEKENNCYDSQLKMQEDDYDIKQLAVDAQMQIDSKIDFMSPVEERILAKTLIKGIKYIDVDQSIQRLQVWKQQQEEELKKSLNNNKLKQQRNKLENTLQKEQQSQSQQSNENDEQANYLESLNEVQQRVQRRKMETNSRVPVTKNKASDSLLTQVKTEQVTQKLNDTNNKLLTLQENFQNRQLEQQIDHCNNDAIVQFNNDMEMYNINLNAISTRINEWGEIVDQLEVTKPFEDMQQTAVSSQQQQKQQQAKFGNSCSEDMVLNEIQQFSKLQDANSASMTEKIKVDFKDIEDEFDEIENMLNERQQKQAITKQGV